MKTKPLSRAFAFSVGVILPAVGGIVPVATGMTRAGRGVSFRLPPEGP